MSGEILGPDGEPARKPEEKEPDWHGDINFNSIVPLFGHHFQPMKARADWIILAYRGPGRRNLKRYDMRGCKIG